MRQSALAAEVVVWSGLVAATVASWWIASTLGAGYRLVFPAVIAVAFVKMWLVGRYFMELREAPALLRRLFDCWIVIFGLATVLLAAL
ncbi:MAG: cytochrome C oxidase subunit IV family protein [Microbacterium sp.]